MSVHVSYPRVMALTGREADAACLPASLTVRLGSDWLPRSVAALSVAEGIVERAGASEEAPAVWEETNPHESATRLVELKAAGPRPDASLGLATHVQPECPIASGRTFPLMREA